MLSAFITGLAGPDLGPHEAAALRAALNPSRLGQPRPQVSHRTWHESAEQVATVLSATDKVAVDR